MRGITRPCRHSLSPELHERWRSHLCGLCLTLRDEAGHAARILTGYDLLLVSVLVDAQAGRAETVTAGPCALRGMRRAEVVRSDAPGSRLAAAASLLAGRAGVEDKVRDGDLPSGLAAPATRRARALGRHGDRLAAESGLPATVMSDAARRAAEVEGPGRSLDELLAPSGAAVATLFERTAIVAGRPGNSATLRRVGDAFGRLAHLIDAVEDYRRDARRGSFNPLAATATPPAEARLRAEELVRSIGADLAEVDMADPELARTLLGPVLERTVARTFRGIHPAPDGEDRSCSTERRPAGTGVLVGAAAVALPALVSLGIFGGRRRPPRGGYYDPYYGPPPGYGGYGYGGYGRRGPGCCDLLACDCCANMACNDCCGGSGDDCCMCCC